MMGARRQLAALGICFLPLDLALNQLFQIVRQRTAFGPPPLLGSGPVQPWFWTITGRAPQSTHDRGYAESREQAMADFKTAWQRKSVVVRRT
jgi:hypothetical protein